MKVEYNETTDRNKDPILEVLKEYITGHSRLLEIGSGTGQHATFIAEQFETLHWVTSDQVEKHKEIKKWLKAHKFQNVHGPETLKIGVDDFPKGIFDYAFTCNTLQVMSWKESKTMFKLFGKRLREGCLVFIYGPLNYGGKFTTESNEEFDKKVKEKYACGGLKNFENVLYNMEKAGFKLLKDHEMPANNRLIVFEKLPFKK